MAAVWLDVKKWIVESGVIPPHHDLLNPNSDLISLANSLRDGVLLCCLVNKLVPGTINEIFNCGNSEFLFLKNIRSFLQACRLLHLVPEQELFNPSELLEISNFGKVIKTIIFLSRSEYAYKLGLTALKCGVDFTDHGGNNLDACGDGEVYSRLEDLILDKGEIDDSPYQQPIYAQNEKVYDDVIKSRASFKSASADEFRPVDSRGFVLQEIVDTEKNYISALELIIKYYSITLKPLLSEEQHCTIFMNIKDILENHQQFYSDLIATLKDGGVYTSQAFEHNRENFLIYGPFLGQLDNAMELLQDLEAKSSDFRKALNRALQETIAKENCRFELRCLIIVPMQRILRYPLLLKTLVKQTPDNHPDKDALNRCLAMMEDISKHMNSVKRDHEMLRTLKSLRKSLRTVDVTIGVPTVSMMGRLRKDGEAMVCIENSGEKSKKRHLFLLEKLLLICKSQTETYSICSVVDLKNFDVAPCSSASKGKFSYGISLIPRTIGKVQGNFSTNIYAKTEELRRKWMEEFATALGNLRLVGMDTRGHAFELQTLSANEDCSVCSKIMWGSFCQGYQCSYPNCNQTVHKDCVSNSRSCVSFQSKGLERSSTRAIRRKTEADLAAPKVVRRMTLYHNRITTNSDANASPMNDHNQELKLNPISIIRDIMDQKWFYGRIGRGRAQSILSGMVDGAFLVRESEQRLGEFALSLIYRNEVKHIKILNFGNSFNITPHKYFYSIMDLITYYQRNTLGRSFPLLDTTLTRPAKGGVSVAVALFDYGAPRSGELKLVKGELVEVYCKDYSWWLGGTTGSSLNGGETGIFPSNFVKEL